MQSNHGRQNQIERTEKKKFIRAQEEDNLVQPSKAGQNPIDASPKR